MLKILLLSSPNAKIMANFLLAKIKPLASYICQVNPFEERKEIFGSFTGMRHAIQNLKDGAPVGIFPAGQVSVRKNGWYGMVDDKEWENSVLKLIKRARSARDTTLFSRPQQRNILHTIRNTCQFQNSKSGFRNCKKQA
jgi:putative hemolysin